MHRIAHDPRPNWQRRLEEKGLYYHTPQGTPYWDESASYTFSTYQVDQIEESTNRLHAMCLEVVAEVIENRDFGFFLIPDVFEEVITRSWARDEPSLYGRFDLAYDGKGAPQMLEYNADTPTSLVEASVGQWFWLKDMDERGDQFNSIHEHLIEAWKKFGDKRVGGIHFAAMADQPEDYITVEYLRDTAIQAGLETVYLDIEQIGWDALNHCYVDMEGRPIRALFKLYPWEWLIREDFGKHIPSVRMTWLEPAWKMLLSSKALLPLLYEKFPDSPLLLPASFDPILGDYIRKPILGREGANMQIVRGGQVVFETQGPYQGPYVYQQLARLPQFDGNYPIIGSWIVDGEACGMGIREDVSPITHNTSRFIPHQMTT